MKSKIKELEKKKKQLEDFVNEVGRMRINTNMTAFIYTQSLKNDIEKLKAEIKLEFGE